jgi:hypothetical protein
MYLAAKVWAVEITTDWLLYLVPVYDSETLPDEASHCQEGDDTASWQSHKAESKSIFQVLTAISLLGFMPCSLIKAGQCFTGMFLAYLMMLFQWLWLYSME